MNPDGFEASNTNNCGENWGTRENANRIDLNRNFPDQFGRTEGALQPETKVGHHLGRISAQSCHFTGHY